MNAKIIGQFVLLAALAVLVGSCAPSGSTTRSSLESPDPVMGDWWGHRVTNDGRVIPVAVQSIALGKNRYEINVMGHFDRRDESIMTFEAEHTGDRLVIPDHPDWQIALVNETISGKTESPDVQTVELHHIARLSPNLGAVPPTGAIVLFDGKNLGAWERRDEKQKSVPVGWKVADGIAEVAPGTGDIVTKQKFTDFQLHVEFRLPFMPEARGQARANSGVYLQGRYEVQVLDSYGLAGEDNECGGIYKVAAPKVNMCAPPGQWQTYDITFQAPRFDKDGQKVKDARATVLHNGVVIHENLTIPGPTGGAIDDKVQNPGGILLQDHGNLVQYRNIWLFELK